MPPLLAKLTGKSAVKNVYDHEAATMKRFTKHEAAIVSDEQFYVKLVAAYEEFMTSPTPEKYARLVELEAHRAAAQVVARSIHERIQSAQAGMRAAGKEKLLAAAAEVRAGIAERRAEIQAGDAARSAEFGVAVPSTAALEKLDRYLDDLNEAMTWINVDYPRAWSGFRTVTGGGA